MDYVSTRGESPKAKFCDILLGGLAPDGGLYMPETYPKVTSAELAEWRELPYAELTVRVLSKYMNDIPQEDLRAMCERVYTAANFAYCRPNRNAADITPLTTLEANFHLLELSNGPTLAFKDMAMQLLGNLFEYVLEKNGDEINILGATSGDTGSAAEYAMMGKKRVRVFMLSPHGRMSDFQRAQMYTIQDPDIHNIAIIGMFDDAQDVVKAVSNDAAFKARYKIGAVNSINWARVAIQVVYYFKGYFAATQNNDQRVDFAVPTGNFGDICAGHVARMMGLPIRQLVLATNENDVLDEFFRTGTYRPRTGTYVTSSPSMDISKASNFERFMFDAVGREAEIVRTLWNDVGTKGYFDLPSGPYHRYWDDPPFDSIKDFGIVSGSSTHTDRMHTIRNVWRRYGVMIDTHTADALKVAREYRDTDIPMVVLETAQACKFEKDVREATGEVPPRPKDLAGIELYPQRVQPMEANVEAVKAYIAKVCNPTSEHLARDGSNI